MKNIKQKREKAVIVEVSLLRDNQKVTGKDQVSTFTLAELFWATRRRCLKLKNNVESFRGES